MNKKQKFVKYFKCWSLCRSLSQITLEFGLQLQILTSQEVEVHKVFLHNEFQNLNPANPCNDIIALIELDSPVKLPHNVRPICLAS